MAKFAFNAANTWLNLRSVEKPCPNPTPSPAGHSDPFQVGEFTARPPLSHPHISMEPENPPLPPFPSPPSEKKLNLNFWKISQRECRKAMTQILSPYEDHEGGGWRGMGEGEGGDS
jgi:hypothetical protein